MPKHHFHLTATWSGGRNGIGTIDAGNLKAEISIPKEMNGPGVGTNPDEMLIGAAGVCYLITLAAIFERENLPAVLTKHETEGIVNQGIRLKFEKIIHRPYVQIQAGASEAQIEAIKEATERAEQNCMISNAVRGNVELEVEAQFEIGE